MLGVATRSVINCALKRSHYGGISALAFRSSSSDMQTIKVEVPRDMDPRFALTKSPVVPRPQDDAPQFKGQAVVNRSFREISLQDYNGKWLVLFFYPLDFTFVCPTEIISFSDGADKFKQCNCELVACSTDSHFSHLAWINTPRKEGGLGEMKIPMLADYTKKISKDYGVLLEGLGAALRGLFIIDPKGKVRHTCVNDLPVGRSVDETLRLVQAFQYFDKHGEVCPANWTPDSPTIDPKDPKKFFNKVN